MFNFHFIVNLLKSAHTNFLKIKIFSKHLCLTIYLYNTQLHYRSYNILTYLLIFVFVDWQTVFIFK